MATATATPLRASNRSNFQSKSERKRIRKSMIRAYVSNRVADARTASAARIDFYRRLRQMKERRILISRQLSVLASMAEAACSKASTIPALVEVGGVVVPMEPVPPFLLYVVSPWFVTAVQCWVALGYAGLLFSLVVWMPTRPAESTAETVSQMCFGVIWGISTGLGCFFLSLSSLNRRGASTVFVCTLTPSTRPTTRNWPISCRRRASLEAACIISQRYASMVSGCVG